MHIATPDDVASRARRGYRANAGACCRFACVSRAVRLLARDASLDASDENAHITRTHTQARVLALFTGQRQRTQTHGTRVCYRSQRGDHRARDVRRD